MKAAYGKNEGSGRAVCLSINGAVVTRKFSRAISGTYTEGKEETFYTWERNG